MEFANGLLYEPYHFSSKWEKGNQRGKQVGYPTINLKWNENLVIPDGVYITRTHIGKKVYNSLTFIGVSKTFDLNKPTIETHILHRKVIHSTLFTLWYKKKIKIDFLEYLRENRKYVGTAGLKEQITKDIAAADKFFHPEINKI